VKEGIFSDVDAKNYVAGKLMIDEKNNKIDRFIKNGGIWVWLSFFVF